MMRIAALVSGLLLAHCALAADWTVEPGSRIAFAATYDGIPFQARFKSFEAHIRFSPQHLDDSSFDVRIDTASVDSDSPDRDSGMKGPEWLAVGEYPEARFHADRFKWIDGHRYEAIGRLTVKGITRKLEVAFAFEPQPGGKAWLNANAHVKRDEFNVGSGQWARDDTIGFDVGIHASLKLAPRR